MSERPLDERSVGPDSKFDLTDILLARGAGPQFELLASLKPKGWMDKAVNDHFVHQRDIADNAGPQSNRSWFRRMKGVLSEVDTSTKCIQSRIPLKFLDLGCSPGGFSSYILSKNANWKTIGLGISLPVNEGGHVLLVEKYHGRRFEFLSVDLTRYQLGPTLIRGRGLQVVPVDIRLRLFDIATLDGHHLRTRTPTADWEVDRLLISQLILALQALKPGGTLVVKLTKPEMVYTAKLLSMLDMVSTRLSVCKPRSLHAIRSTFYAVAEGVDGEGTGNRAMFLDALKKLWVELTFGGQNGSGRFMTDDDLDFIITTEELQESYLDHLIVLAQSVWSVQAPALEELFTRKGVS